MKQRYEQIDRKRKAEHTYKTTGKVTPGATLPKSTVPDDDPPKKASPTSKTAPPKKKY